MLQQFLDLYLSVLQASNRVLIVTVLVTAISLLLYTLSFNLRDRVARTSLVLLACLSVVYFGDVMAQVGYTPNSADANNNIIFWLRLQWIGIGLMPPAYFHFSDALLATTGRPSRGRRFWGVRIAYLIGIFSIGAALFTDWVVSGHANVQDSAQWLSAGAFFIPFTILFSIGCSWAVINIYRAYRRCQTTTARRRMWVLLISSTAFPSGAFPYLLLPGGSLFENNPHLFLQLAVLANAVLGLMIIVLVYTVSFFGMRQAERVIRSRLFKWTLRGPVSASFVVAAYAFARLGVRRWGWSADLVVPVSVVLAGLIPQFIINLVRVPLESWLFYGSRTDRAELQRIQQLSDRLLTRTDVNQYLEALLASVCEIFRTQHGFVSVGQGEQMQIDVWVGGERPSVLSDPSLNEFAPSNTPIQVVPSQWYVQWQNYRLMPLRVFSAPTTAPESDTKTLPLLPAGAILGFLAVEATVDFQALSLEDEQAVLRLLANAARALEDLRLQQQVTQALDNLLPQVDEFQRVQAASRTAGATAFGDRAELSDSDAGQWVKDALSHYWGGPKLTDNPLLKLTVVRNALERHDGNATNALREILRNAIEQTRPEGTRKFTTEWLLYNILEMKFLQGRKVREVAMRLAVSEADLYRKQKIAIDEVTQAILKMEDELEQQNGAEK
ncbi:MAG TPA: hypothetical protein PK299_04755 [Anaerolineales bacterium]|nr:hypothetical protein [Anaerolineales bacterium]